MNDLGRDVLRLWDRAVAPENIARYLMVSEEYVLDVIEAPGNYGAEEETCQKSSAKS